MVFSFLNEKVCIRWFLEPLPTLTFYEYVFADFKDIQSPRMTNCIDNYPHTTWRGCHYIIHIKVVWKFKYAISGDLGIQQIDVQQFSFIAFSQLNLSSIYYTYCQQRAQKWPCCSPPSGTQILNPASSNLSLFLSTIFSSWGRQVSPEEKTDLCSFRTYSLNWKSK